MTLLHRFKTAGIAAGFFLALAALTNCVSAANDTIILDTTKAPNQKIRCSGKSSYEVITPKADYFGDNLTNDSDTKSGNS